MACAYSHIRKGMLRTRTASAGPHLSSGPCSPPMAAVSMKLGYIRE
jgi:hypothetical protein